LEPRRQTHPAARRDKARLQPRQPLTAEDHERNNLPDALARWSARNWSERDRARTEQSFCVAKADIVAEGYDLSINRYREIVYDEGDHRTPLEILDELERIEDEIRAGIEHLKGTVA
jgi:type I restriction enzyme M protein